MDDTLKKTPITDDKPKSNPDAPDAQDKAELKSLRGETAEQFSTALKATETHNGMPLLDEDEFRRLYETDADAMQSANEDGITTFDFRGYVRASGKYAGPAKDEIYYKDVIVTNGLLKTEKNKGIHVGTDGIFGYYNSDKNHNLQGPEEIHEYDIYIVIPSEIQLEKNMVCVDDNCRTVSELQNEGKDDEDIKRWQSQEGWIVIITGIDPDEDPHAREKASIIHHAIVQYIKDGGPLDRIRDFAESIEKKLEKDVPSKDKTEKTITPNKKVGIIQDPNAEDEDEFAFKPAHELKSIENLDEVFNWFKEEVIEHIDSDYMSGYRYSDLVGDILEYLSKKFGLKMNFNPETDIKHKESYGDENTTGYVSIMGEEIFRYGHSGDGYGSSIYDWSDEDIKRILGKLIKGGK